MSGKCPFGGDDIINFNPLLDLIVESKNGFIHTVAWYYNNNKVYEAKGFIKNRIIKKVEKYRNSFILKHKEHQSGQ